MNARPWLAVIATMFLPSLCFAQTWQVSNPGYAPAPAFRSMMPNRMMGGMMQGSDTRGALPQPDANSPAMPATAMPAPAMSAPMMSSPNAPASATFSDIGYADTGYADADGCNTNGGCSSYGEYSDYDTSSGGCSTNCCDTACGGGTYFSLFGGLADLNNQQSTGFQRNLQIQYDQGYALGGAIGRRIGSCFRTELEYVFRSQTPGIVNFNGNFPGNVGGIQNSHAGMLNCVYDMIIGYGNIVPYIGGGVGVAGIDSRVRYGNMGTTLDGDDTSLAYQGMAGLTYRARPNLEMFVEYRFFEIDDPKLNRFGGPMIGAQTPNILLNSEYVSNDIFVGIRFNR